MALRFFYEINEVFDSSYNDIVKHLNELEAIEFIRL